MSQICNCHTQITIKKINIGKHFLELERSLFSGGMKIFAWENMLKQSASIGNKLKSSTKSPPCRREEQILGCEEYLFALSHMFFHDKACENEILERMNEKKKICIVSRTFPGSFTIFWHFSLRKSKNIRFNSSVRAQLKMASGKRTTLGHFVPSGPPLFSSGIFQLCSNYYKSHYDSKFLVVDTRLNACEKCSQLPNQVRTGKKTQ